MNWLTKNLDFLFGYGTSFAIHVLIFLLLGTWAYNNITPPQLPSNVKVHLFYSPEQIKPQKSPTKSTPQQKPAPTQNTKTTTNKTSHKPIASAKKSVVKTPKNQQQQTTPSPKALTQTPQVFSPIATTINNSKPQYPTIARRMHWQGTVLLKVSVSPIGLPTSIEVIESSGHKILDNSAIKTVQTWRFIPARKNHHTISGEAIIPITFRLNH